jgi:hypothetical protein
METSMTEMDDDYRRLALAWALCCAAILLAQACGTRPAAATTAQHVRGIVETVQTNVVTISTAT